LLVPQLSRPTDEPAPMQPMCDPCANRGVMMPTRQRTRTADRALRRRHERALNEIDIAKRDAIAAEPPPF